MLSTAGADGRAALVPICFALRGEELISAIDHKPKSSRDPARVRNLSRDPRVTVLFDRWSEDWSELGWVRVEGVARLEPPGYAAEELRARYSQYDERSPSGEVIVVSPERVLWWLFERPRGAG